MQGPDATAGVTYEATGWAMMLSTPADAFGELDDFFLPCMDNPELFFAEQPADVERAKALCQGCRARTDCLRGALERQEPWGVWGGELLLRGTIVPYKRPRGRPAKTDPAITVQAAGQAA